ncbi:uncharacterized protein LOC123205691 [Mangifera indica]|uniref:uncharacterized protein LOC123205691 n=1 Tax=Mangifera indica TaxID=29780 RepID=UPI001CFB85CA|nr:uncharacterized protein LOC123205691 [Mangifera indica]
MMHRLEPGSVILLNKCMMLEVEFVCHYASFSELEAESLVKVLPGVKTVEEGVQIYRYLYVEEKERLNGVLAICIYKLATQPYITWPLFSLDWVMRVFKVFWALHILLEQFRMPSPHQDKLFCHHSCCHLNQRFWKIL